MKPEPKLEKFTKAQEIMFLFIQGENGYHYTINNEVGRTYENYIKQIKTDAVMDAIEFTLKHIEEKEKNKK